MCQVANCKTVWVPTKSPASIGVTQKTGWIIESAILSLWEVSTNSRANMHKDVKARRITGTGGNDKTAVLGILELGGKIVPQGC